MKDEGLVTLVSEFSESKQFSLSSFILNPSSKVPVLYFSYASVSSDLYDFKRESISSKSTSCASNSGPSTHTNFVLPPTVTRHAPHIPVPSTMMVFRLASVGIWYFLVDSAT